MYGLTVIEVMSLSGHLSNIDKIFDQEPVVMQNPQLLTDSKDSKDITALAAPTVLHNSTLQPYNSHCTMCFSVNSVLALKRAGLKFEQMYTIDSYRLIHV